MANPGTISKLFQHIFPIISLLFRSLFPPEFRKMVSPPTLVCRSQSKTKKRSPSRTIMYNHPELININR